MSLVTLGLFFVCLGILIYKYIKYAKHYAPLNKIEHVNLSPYTNMVTFAWLKPHTLTEMVLGTSLIYLEKRMSVVYPFLAPYVFMSGARQAEAVLKSRNIDKSREYNSMKPWLGEGLIAGTGDHWRKHRRILTPTFHYEILHQYCGIFAGHGVILVKKLEEMAAGQAIVNIWPLFNMATLDGICEAVIGRHFDAQGGGESEYAKAICRCLPPPSLARRDDVSFLRVTKIVRERMQQPWLWNPFIFGLTAAGREHKRCLDLIHGFGDQIVREKLEERAKLRKEKAVETRGHDEPPKKRKMAFLELLADLAEEDILTPEEIRIELDNFIFAGHDTSTMGLNWTIFMLGHHPEYQKKIQAELDTYIQSPSDYNMENMKNLTYLECCFKEAIRLYPPVPFLGRVIDEELKIDSDVTLPSGTTVTLIPMTIHRDPEFWPDPERYDPDRFLPENSVNRYPFSYIPFSAGSRNCIGQRFAMLEAKVLLGMILQRFTVESVDQPHQVQSLMELVLRPQGPIRIRLHPRAPRL